MRTFICEDVSEELSSIELFQVDNDTELKIVAYSWQNLLEIDKIIEDFLLILARISFELWPVWYNKEVSDILAKKISSDDFISNNFAINEILKIKDKISKKWLKEAILCCMANKIPLPKGFSNMINVSQLSLTIDVENLIIVLGLENTNIQANKLFGFAKASEWFAMETRARIAVIIPETYSNCKELESILYNALIIKKANKTDLLRDSNSNESKFLFWPYYGKPHPFSPGEQKLAKYLSNDNELSGLFQFNHKISTIYNNNFIVDLLWIRGKLVIEVDSYKYHSNKYAFNKDRNRDYELIISGYTILRIPHDEIIEDVQLVIEKIRNVVRFCNNKL